MKHISVKLFTALSVLFLLAGVVHAGENDGIPYWKDDSPAMHSIMQFVEDVTDESSPEYVPEEERIAVFDLDGTLTGERYPEASMRILVMDRLLEEGEEADPDALELARSMEAAIQENAPLPKFTLSATAAVADLFSGFTLDEYKEYLKDFMKRPVGGFEGMTYGTRFFKPMVSLVEYLYENGFQVYIISGSERMFAREQIAGTLDEWIPASRVIGSTLSLTATGEGDTSGSDYTYSADDQVLMGDSVVAKAVKMNKVSSIVNEIGAAPVLAFGNSSGDYAMGQYCVQNGGKAYMLLCDDTERDYGDEAAAAGCAEDCASLGFETVSMRDEFETIYGEEMDRSAGSPSEQGPALISEYWTEGSGAAENLNAYLQAVTDEASPDFIPVEDRIAVFDLDGTLMCETYPFCFEYMVFSDYVLNHSDKLPEEVVAVAQEIEDAAGKEKPDGMSTRQAGAGAIAYQGMTMDEIAQMVRDFKESDAWGFSGMTRKEAFYKPMVELFNVLLEDDFTVYVVTATERNIVREVINGTLNIPPSYVIGTEYGYTATGQGEEADGDYTFQPSDQIVFDGTYEGENAKTCKVDAIVREIGQQPVLAFGNSSGDLAMEIYTISDNPYKSAAYMVVADDEEREYGDAAGAEEKKQSYEEQGIGIISMRDDFKTIYGDDVVRENQAISDETELDAAA